MKTLDYGMVILIGFIEVYNENLNKEDLKNCSLL